MFAIELNRNDNRGRNFTAGLLNGIFETSSWGMEVTIRDLSDQQFR